MSATTTQLTPAERIRLEAREATRKALLQAGLAETVHNGGVVPSIESICARAGFTRGAFYVHFKSRCDFVVQMLLWLVGDIYESIFSNIGRGEADLPSAIRRYTDVLVSGTWPSIGDIRSAYMTVLAGLRESDTVRERHEELMGAAVSAFEHIFQDGKKSGSVRDEVDPRSVAELLCILSIGAFVWTDAGLKLDPTRLSDSLITLIAPSGNGTGT